jgi:hypothetical protein
LADEPLRRRRRSQPRWRRCALASAGCVRAVLAPASHDACRQVEGLLLGGRYRDAGASASLCTQPVTMRSRVRPRTR